MKSGVTNGCYIEGEEDDQQTIHKPRPLPKRA